MQHIKTIGKEGSGHSLGDWALKMQIHMQKEAAFLVDFFLTKCH